MIIGWKILSSAGAQTHFFDTANGRKALQPSSTRKLGRSYTVKSHHNAGLKMHNAPSPGLTNVHPHSEDPTAARRMVQRPPVDSSAAILPFRPPKSPFSLNTPHVHPKSPPLPRKSKVLPHGLHTDKHKREADPSKALSPTSVVDSRSSVFRERHSSGKTERQRPNESDASLVEAGNACVKVSWIPLCGCVESVNHV
jgi:hypothetical protein